MGLPLFLGHIPRFTREEIDTALEEDDREVLLFAGISSATHEADWKFTQDLCLKLYEHPNKTIRGNAVLALTTVALYRGTLDREAVEPILLRALRDEEMEVRLRAEDAIREINTILNWTIAKDKLPREESD
jgi:hypothetical protein